MAKHILFMLLPTALLTLIVGAIGVLSEQSETEHPPGVVQREYWPDDGWWNAKPAEHGLESSHLGQARRFILDNYPNFTSFLIVRDGYLVWEQYYGGKTGIRTLHNMYSATKAVTSLLIGIAIQEGYITGVDQTLGDFFPEYFAVNPSQAGKAAITIEDLLTMRSGLEWSEWEPPPLTDPYGDQVMQMLVQPLAATPGEVYNYSSGDSYLLSAIITKATGVSALTFAGRYLFEPLGIVTRQWISDRQGNEYGGTGLYLNSREIAALGLLYLNRGYWDGKQIVSPEWIEQSWEPHVVLRPEENSRGLPAVSYGYQWWLRDQGGYRSAMAVGFGGQYLVIFPELDMAVVLTANPDPYILPEDMRGTGEIDFRLFEDYIIPAVIDAGAAQPVSARGDE
ncbi:MAG: serine hydrolase [Anaerolineae bacterium]